MKECVWISVMELLPAPARRGSEETPARRWTPSVTSSPLACMGLLAQETSAIMSAIVHGVWVGGTVIRVSQSIHEVILTLLIIAFTIGEEIGMKGSGYLELSKNLLPHASAVDKESFSFTFSTKLFDALTMW